MMVARTCSAGMAFCTLLDQASKTLERPPGTPDGTAAAMRLAEALLDEADGAAVSETARALAREAAGMIRDLAEA